MKGLELFEEQQCCATACTLHCNSCCCYYCCCLMQEWTVGPIPTADNVGKEVVIRSITELQTGEGSTPRMPNRYS